MIPRPLKSTLFPYTTLFRSRGVLSRPPHLPAHQRRLRRRRGGERSRSARGVRSEEHTSELQSRGHLVCRLLLEKKKRKQHYCTSKMYNVTADSNSKDIYRTA